MPHLHARWEQLWHGALLPTPHIYMQTIYHTRTFQEGKSRNLASWPPDAWRGLGLGEALGRLLLMPSSILLSLTRWKILETSPSCLAYLLEGEAELLLLVKVGNSNWASIHSLLSGGLLTACTGTTRAHALPRG